MVIYGRRRDNAIDSLVLGRQTPNVQHGDTADDFGGLMEAGGCKVPSAQALVLELMRWLMRYGG